MRKCAAWSWQKTDFEMAKDMYATALELGHRAAAYNLGLLGGALGHECSRRCRPRQHKGGTGLQARWFQRKVRRPSGRIAGPLEVNRANRACRCNEKRALNARFHSRLSGCSFGRGRDIRRRAHLFGANQFLRRCLLRCRRLCRALLRDSFQHVRSA